MTLGLVLSKQLPAVRALFLFPAQLLAAMCAGGLVSAMFPGDIAVTNTVLAPGVSIAQGLFIEMFLTTQLVFVVLMLAAEKSKDTFLAPVGIGLALFVAELAGTSGCASNYSTDSYLSLSLSIPLTVALSPRSSSLY